MNEALSALRARYKTLAVPPVPLEGRYRGELIGPAWFRRLASSALGIGRLRGWWGKEFDGKGSAVNLVMRDDKLEEVAPMRVTRTASVVDGAATVVLSSDTSSPFAFVHVIDELRQLEADGTMLGLNVIVLPRGMHCSLPFILRPQR